MVPPRSSASNGVPSAVRKPTSSSPALPFEALKARVLAKLEDRMDPAASRRMPASLLRQSLRTFAEQIADQDARSLARPDRDRLVEEVLAELLGCGPLEELFNDPTVREVMVAGPHAVIVRREHATWVPTPVRFRDDEHLRAAIDRLATHADPVGGVTTSVNLYDLKLPNGFRAVAVIPPPALGAPANVAFIRTDAAPPPAAEPAAQAPARSPPPAGTAAAPRLAESDPLTRHRNRIVERLMSKLAGLGVYDLGRVETAELRRAVAAFVSEYCAKENIYLSDTDQGRLQLEILAAMNR